MKNIFLAVALLLGLVAPAAADTYVTPNLTYDTTNQTIYVYGSDGVPYALGTIALGSSWNASIPVTPLEAITGTGTLSSGATGVGFTLNLGASTVVGDLPCANTSALNGDITSSAGSCATTLANVNSGSGSVGSSTAIPVLTTNGKGQVTAQSTAAVVAPAGTLSGATLNSTVTASSLTIFGAITVLGFDNLWESKTAPTIGTCGSGSPSISANNGTGAFRITIGSTGPPSACSVTMPAAATGWNCFAQDVTTATTSIARQKLTASSSTSITITNYNTSIVATAFVANDVIEVSCFAY
jgi:hypothetical protein